MSLQHPNYLAATAAADVKRAFWQEILQRIDRMVKDADRLAAREAEARDGDSHGGSVD